MARHNKRKDQGFVACIAVICVLTLLLGGLSTYTIITMGKMQGVISDMESKLAAEQAESSDYADLLAEKDAIITEKENENADLKNENAELKGENAELKDENEDLKDENADLKVQIALRDTAPGDPNLPVMGPYNDYAGQKIVALTFDDGPGRYSREFADLLTRYGARATFFVLGANVKNFAEDLQYVYEQGNEIASHTMRHKNLDLLSTADIEKEIDQAAEAIHDAIGVYPTLVRTPYGNANDKVMKVIDGPMIKWSVDTEDWKSRNAQAVKNEIIKGCGDGEIILLHEIYASSLEGLELALKELSAKDYQFVTVSELMQYRGVTPECKHYYSIEKE